MLSARVISEGVRACFPGCIEGFYTPEEQEDIPQETDPKSELLEALESADTRVIEGEVIDNITIEEEIKQAQSLTELSAAGEKIKKMSEKVQDKMRPLYKSRFANLKKMENSE